MAENQTWEKMKRRCKEFLKEKKKTILLIIGMIGILMIGASSLFDKDKSSAQAANVSQTDQYAAELELRLEKMVSSIRGAGRADVTVMLENGVEYVYANEEKHNSDHSQNDRGDVSNSDDNHRTVVTIDDGNGKSGLLITEIQPTVRGVVVTCEGGDDAVVIALIKEAVTTALDITEKHVCVIPYNTEGV